MDLNVLRAWIQAKFTYRLNERGANLVEYVLVLAFIALIVIAVVKGLGGKVSEKFSSASSTLAGS
jgi:Flp pilus assembly pilin Flp